MGGASYSILDMNTPQLVNKLVLAGTRPGMGEGVTLPLREVLESAGANNDQPPSEDDMMTLFFYPSETSLALGHAWWKRIHERNVEGETRKAYLTGAQSQLAAIFKFTTDARNFDRLADIKAPALVTNGHTDIMSPTSSSFVLQQKIANAHLHLYPDAGHGHPLQEPELYAKELELFLTKLSFVSIASLLLLYRICPRLGGACLQIEGTRHYFSFHL
ncbi:Alpha/Beta hydrolase protein [Aspergillus navahoensis]